MKVRRAVAPILSLINDMQSPSGLRLTGIKPQFLGHSSDESISMRCRQFSKNETGEIYETAIGVIGRLACTIFRQFFIDSS